MKYDRTAQHQIDIRTFHYILNDYLICKERNLTSALPSLERELVRWFDRVTGIGRG